MEIVVPPVYATYSLKFFAGKAFIFTARYSKLPAMRYTFTTQVLNVEEKFAPDRTVGKDTEGKWQFEAASLGWFITTVNNIAYGVGTERHEVAKGDVVRITLEKV